MNLIITGHSVSHYRQRMLGEATAKQGVKTVVVGPDHWGDEYYKEYKKKNFSFKTRSVSGRHSFYTFIFKKLNRVISTYRPCVIYCMEEPFTLFARDCIRLGKEFNCPVVFFTWENRLNYQMGDSFSRIEKENLRDAEKIICGNKLARQRMINCGADKEKLSVLLQTGVDMDLFKKTNSEKTYDVLYHGRLVRQKGLYYLENVCRKLQASLLTVGGRGSYHVRYGDSLEWVDYEDLADVINKSKIAVQIPYSWQGYQEQGNYAIAEAMACEIPVIISDNGSLVDNYGSSPVNIIPEGNQDELLNAIEQLLNVDECKREEIGRHNREWVEKNLSLEAMSKKLLETLGIT